MPVFSLIQLTNDSIGCLILEMARDNHLSTLSKCAWPFSFLPDVNNVKDSDSLMTLHSV